MLINGNIKLKEVVQEMRYNEMYRNGNVILFKDKTGKIYGRIIK